MSEYVYKNADDSVRITVFDRDTELGREWDVDIFHRHEYEDYYGQKLRRVWTYSIEMADYFFLKRDALAWATEQFGEMKSINPRDRVTEGWPE